MHVTAAERVGGVCCTAAVAAEASRSSGDSGAGLWGGCPPTAGLRNGGCGWSASIFRVGERVRYYRRRNLQGLLLEMLFLSVSCLFVFVGWDVLLDTPHEGGRNQATLVGEALIGQTKGN